LANLFAEVAGNPEEYDPYFCHQRDDGTWKAAIFSDYNELLTAIYGLAFKAKVMTVYSITRVYFEGGFSIRL
jgi:hypothetical protein